jgi:hypothetical protein
VQIILAGHNNGSGGRERSPGAQGLRFVAAGSAGANGCEEYLRSTGWLVMRYLHADAAGLAKRGTCVAAVEALPDGSVRLHEHWRWDGTRGSLIRPHVATNRSHEGRARAATYSDLLGY